ncbi:MAG: GatB/YqeY domain-containing protein [Bacteroidota bacterium]
MSLFDQINNDIKAAMLAREKDKLEALRSIKSAFLLAKTEKGDSDLPDEKAVAIVQKLAKQRHDSAEIYKQNNRMDLYDKEIFEAGVIEAYLPKQMDDGEIAAEVKKIIAQTGASGMKDMGKVMGMATKAMAGKADNKKIADTVKNMLGG